MDPLPDAPRPRYRIDRLLGAGGMGSVYLAHDLSLDRPVAIKFLSDDKAGDKSASRRLLREARAAAALDHPNICNVYEVLDDADGRPCIVMQYVEGETLAQKLRGGPLEVHSALNIAADIASALSVAHKHNVVHRDLKPQNVIITPDRRAKLLDFGIARYAEPAGISSDATTASRLTETGDTPGTPAYMSPEQVHGRSADARSDLFALGAVLYECLTGRRAFEGRNAMELAGQIVSQDPPAPSAIRPELTTQHDELCRRLLAKDPRDRYASADEVLGALQLLSTGTSHTRAGEIPRKRGWTRGALAVAAVVIVAAAIGYFALKWRSAPTMPRDPQAAEWYRRGIEAIREGLPHSARLALTEAVRAEPDFAPAFIRLAEAEIELDDAEAAQQALLRIASRKNDSRLGEDDRVREEAVRAWMLRELPAAVSGYRKLAERNPRDPGAWLDVGRALDASGLRSDARVSYETALQINDDYAPAHLRRGTILGSEGQIAEALRAFDEAARLYRAAANAEGEVEALIRRGVVLNGSGELKESRAALERARELARSLGSSVQRIRAELTLSSVIASEGNWKEAEKMAAAAVQDALRAELESVAAEGLIELGTTLQFQNRRDEANAHFLRATELAQKRGQRTIVAHANLQRASLMLDNDRPAEALAIAGEPLPYLRANHYRRFELSALTIMARASEELGQYSEARQLAEECLHAATEIKDDGRMADALENLAGQANRLGALPSALDYRKRALEIHRRQNDLSTVAYDLVNTAEILIRLGRHDEARNLLDEVTRGVEKKVDAYVPRQQRAATLRLMSAAIERRSADLQRLAESLRIGNADTSDLDVQFIDIMLRYSDAPAGQGGPRDRRKPVPAGTTSPMGREVRYWGLMAALSDDAKAALEGAEGTLRSADGTVSYEFEWRVAAIGAAAARGLKDSKREEALRARAAAALSQLRAEWKTDVATYETRPDLVELQRKAGLDQRS